MMDRRVSGRIRKAVDYDEMAKGTYKRREYQISGKEIVEKIVIELCNNVVKEEICQISIKEELLQDSEIMTCENSIKQEPSDNIRINDPLDIHNNVFIDKICQISIKKELLDDSEIMNFENSIKQEPFDNKRIDDPLDIHGFKFNPIVHGGINKYENTFIENVHEGNESNNCEITSSMPSTLQKWMCYPCDKSYNQKSGLKHHNERYHNICAKCDKTFQSKSKHYQISHTKRPRIECKYCELSFNNKKLYDAHLKKSHVSQKNWFKCRVCKEVLKGKKSRISHEEKVHGHLKQTCEMCNEVCLNTNFLSKHIANKHCTVNDNDKFVCCYCKKEISFSSCRGLVYHIMREHFNQHPHPCNQCKKGFSTNHKLSVHIQSVHKDERKYHCKNCDKTFIKAICLKRHVKNIHEESENLECDECGKICKNKTILNIHLKVAHHSNIRIVCRHCGSIH